MFAYQNAWNVNLQLCKKVVFVNMVHIQFMAQMASLATSIIITQRVKPFILSKMVLVSVVFLMLQANVLQQEL